MNALSVSPSFLMTVFLQVNVYFHCLAIVIEMNDLISDIYPRLKGV
jgi:hypothetical protein